MTKLLITNNPYVLSFGKPYLRQFFSKFEKQVPSQSTFSMEGACFSLFDNTSEVETMAPPTPESSLVPGLGNLILLPAEIRSKIYDECLQQRHFGLLYSSKEIYSEFIPLLREKFVLTFHIDPSESEMSSSRCTTDSRVHIVNKYNQSWGHARNEINTASPHRDEILDDMPIDEFGKIRILIDAPNPRDPGQIVRVWYQCTRLMSALLPQWKYVIEVPETQADLIIPRGRKSSELPPIEIVLTRSGAKTWSSGGNLNHSVPCYDGWNPVTQSVWILPEGQHSDLEVVLMPFCRIRNAASVTVQLPPDCPNNRYVNAIRAFLSDETKGSDPFGTLVHNGGQCAFGSPCFLWGSWDSQGEGLDGFEDDETVLGREHAMSAWLDYLLDDMDGDTARLLRRERFENWCSEHEYQHGMILAGASVNDRDFGSPYGFINPALLDRLCTSFYDRYVGGMNLKQHEVWRLLREDAFAWKDSFPDGVERKSSLGDFWPDSQPLDFWWSETLPRHRSGLTMCLMSGELRDSRCEVCRDDKDSWAVDERYDCDVCKEQGHCSVEHGCKYPSCLECEEENECYIGADEIRKTIHSERWDWDLYSEVVDHFAGLRVGPDFR